MKSRLKNIAILFLVIISLVQTSRLWFGVSVSYNLFYSVKSFLTTPSGDASEKAYLASPYRVISKTANNDYRIKYNGLYSNPGKYNADLILNELLQSGSFVSESDLNWADALKRNCLIYDYSINLPADTFVECFAGVPGKNHKLSGRVRFIDYIVFIPAISSAANSTVLFIDGGASKSYEYSVRVKKSVSDNLRLYIEERSEGDLSYISSAQSGITANSENLFIPNFPGNGFEYPVLNAHNPYVSSGGVISLKSVQHQILNFFDTSPIKQITPDDTTYRYANDANVVVRYNLINNTLEYSDYSAPSRQTGGSFASDFAAAVRFIRLDPNVSNDFYLDAYEPDGDRHTFFFNYAVSDLPLLLSDSVKAELGMGHVIEITVENRMPVKYKRLAVNFAEDDRSPDDIAVINFYDFLNAFYSSSERDIDLHEVMYNVKLGYMYDSNTRLPLKWALDSGGRDYTRPVK